MKTNEPAFRFLIKSIFFLFQRKIFKKATNQTLVTVTNCDSHVYNEALLTHSIDANKNHYIDHEAINGEDGRINYSNRGPPLHSHGSRHVVNMLGTKQIDKMSLWVQFNQLTKVFHYDITFAKCWRLLKVFFCVKETISNRQFIYGRIPRNPLHAFWPFIQKMFKHIKNSQRETFSTFSSLYHNGTFSQIPKNLLSLCLIPVVVVIAFFLCWCPFHVQRIIFTYIEHRAIDENLSFSINYISGVLFFVSTCINPFLYNM